MNKRRKLIKYPITAATAALLLGGAALAGALIMQGQTTPAMADPASPEPAEHSAEAAPQPAEHSIEAAPQPADAPAPVENVEYPVNAAGQTYGSLSDAPTDSQAPDLILVQLADGTEGYVLREDLFEAENANPASPEEALAIQAEQEREAAQRSSSTGGSTGLPVYDALGQPVAGETWDGVE
jgi:hypothetical protein